MSYTPPLGSRLPINFSVSYTTPSGSVSFTFADSPAYLAPNAIANGAVGGATVALRSPSIIPSGFVATDFGTALTALKARQVITQWTVTDNFGVPAAHYVQTVAPTGIAAPSLGNAHKAILGYYSPPYGFALPFNFTGGYYPPAGFSVPMEFTNTYRGHQVALYSGIPASGMGAPTILGIRQVAAPVGLPPYGVGVPVVELHRNIVGTKGFDMSLWGVAEVYNKTPMVYPEGNNHADFGRAGIINRNAYVGPEGFTNPIGFNTIFGSATVADRTRRIYIAGVESLKMAFYNRVHFDIPETPSQQYVLPSGIVPFDLIGHPVVDYRGVAPLGVDTSKFGLPIVTTRAIGPVSIPWVALDGFGNAHVISYQTVYPVSIGDTLFGTPRTSVVTIDLDVRIEQKYAVDFDDFWLIERPKWGTGTTVTHRVRSVTPYQQSDVAMGLPQLELRTRYVSPKGLLSYRSGVHSLNVTQIVHPFWDRTTEVEIPPVNDVAHYGVHEVTHVFTGTQHVGPQSSSGSIGEPTVSYRNRTISGVGAIFSQVFTGDNYVHPPIRLYPTGKAMGSFGSPMVAYRIRTVAVDSSEFDTRWGVELGGGVYPMRVKYTNRLVAPSGFITSTFGHTYTGIFEQVVQPAGIAPSIGVPALSAKTSVSPTGFNSSVLGTPRRPNTNLIEPTGEVLEAFGMSRIDRIIHAPYTEVGVMGTLPRVNRGVRPSEIQGVFGDTVVIGESNCASTLAVSVTLNDLTTFGQAGVHR